MRRIIVITSLILACGATPSVNICQGLYATAEKGTVDMAALEHDVALAVAILSKHWRPIISPLPLSVQVRAVNEWEHGDGWVAGLAYFDDGHIEVGPSGGVLAHEIAHIMRWRLDKETDDDHSAWETNGIRAALNEYEVHPDVRPLLEKTK